MNLIDRISDIIDRIIIIFKRLIDFPDVNESVRADWKDIKDYYLSQTQKDKLNKMGWLKRNIFERIWLLEIMFAMLRDYKKVILLIAFMSIFMSISFRDGESNINIHFGIIAVLAVLYLLMAEIKEKLLAKDELESGRKVQVSMTPTGVQNLKNWDVWLFSDPAKEVGGDLLDIYSIDGINYNISVGDVSGKGLAAALTMVKLRASIRALIGIISSPQEIIIRVNEIFRRDKSRAMFSSLVFLTINDSANGNCQINLINAGHMPPIIIKNKSSLTNHISELDSNTNQDFSFIELKRTSPAIGIMDNLTSGLHNIDIEKGDKIIIYSDGITEAKDELGNFFGTPRLFKIIRDNSEVGAEEIGTKIINAVALFRNSAPVYDDLTLAVIDKL